MDQLEYLKGMTIRLDSIHEAQKTQLMWYGLLINGTKNVTLKIDTEKKIVYYECEADKFRNSKFNKGLYPKIDSWAKLLLWPTTVIVISVNGKVVYDSRS
jgi:hypothetical protein